MDPAGASESSTDQAKASAPVFQDIVDAAGRIEPYLRPTLFYNHPGLSRDLGFEAWVKHENHQPVGAFKVRGGVNLLAQMPRKERARGVVGASTGNHGQSIAYAARLFGTKATIVVPSGANPAKVEAMKGLGADVVVHGRDYEEAKRHCEALVDLHGYRYVHSANEPALIAGVGTYALEMMREVPDLDAILVPVGGGSGACGCCLVADELGNGTRVIGVQSAQAPAAYLSWKARDGVTAPIDTFAEGLATGAPFELTQAILRERLADFVLVDDADIRAAIRTYLERTQNLAEGAGAAALAAGFQLRDPLKGKKVGIVLSGGNLSMAQLRQVLAEGHAQRDNIFA